MAGTRQARSTPNPLAYIRWLEKIGDDLATSVRISRPSAWATYFATSSSTSLVSVEPWYQTLV